MVEREPVRPDITAYEESSCKAVAFCRGEEGWGGVAAAAEAEGAVEAVMRSGVDGDVCGLVFANAEVRRAFEGLLEAAAVEYGLMVRTVSYADFGQLLSEALGGRSSG